MLSQRRHPSCVIVSATEHPTPAVQFKGELCAEKAEAIRNNVVDVVTGAYVASAVTTRAKPR